MAQNITLLGANYPDVPAVTLPITGGGTATFSDTRSVTYNLTGGASASVSPSEVVAGQGFSVKLKSPAGYNLSNVSVTMGGVDITSQVLEYDEGGGGGGPSATQHTIYFEFSDSTNTTINAWYDDAFISNAITATTPTTYEGKTVTLAQLDGVTWYEPADIPLNTQLIDYTKVLSDTMIDQNGDAIQQQWYYATDYTHIESGMTFAYRAAYWWYMAFYDSSKTFISSIYVANDSTQDPDIGTVGVGTLSGSKIPSNATYIRMTVAGNSADGGSLIRTA